MRIYIVVPAQYSRELLRTAVFLVIVILLLDPKKLDCDTKFLLTLGQREHQQLRRANASELQGIRRTKLQNAGKSLVDMNAGLSIHWLVFYERKCGITLASR